MHKDKNYFKPGETYVSTKNGKRCKCVTHDDEKASFKSLTPNKQRNHHFALYYPQLQNYVKESYEQSGN